VRSRVARTAILPVALLVSLPIAGSSVPTPASADFVLKNFEFKSGETLPELRIHYRTYGLPRRDSRGSIANAVLLLHGTTGSGAQFVTENFAGILFGPGQLLDAASWYVILPDGIGHSRRTACAVAFHGTTTTTWSTPSTAC
jgi:homoserine O-acetyltransferase